MYARLEQLVKTEQEKFYSLIETQNTRIDYYETLTTVLYTGPVKKPKITIRDFPACGIQLHIHEGPGGISHFKTYNEEYIEISSEAAALGDLLADNLETQGIMKIKKIIKF